MADIAAPVSGLKGVGAVKKAALEKLGIHTAGDLFWHFPRDYEDRRKRLSVSALSPGMTALISVSVLSIEKGGGACGGRAGRRPLKLLARDETGAL